MSKATPEEMQAILRAFEWEHSATLRGIRAGKMTSVPCEPDGITNTVEIGGRHFKLVSVEEGTIGALLETEPEVMAKEIADIRRLSDLCGDLVEEKAALLREVAMLRAAIGPYESVTMRAIHNPENGELIGSQTIKRQM